MTATSFKQPWLQSAAFDGLYILSPGLLALIISFLLPAHFTSSADVPLAAWVILILCVDVAHVYSTLFRTYWDKQRLQRHKTLYIAIPACCYLSGVVLYTLSDLLFWRVLAYTAVFHFIRQQYGIMRLYTRQENRRTTGAIIDTIAIYAATVYPIIYWHLTPGRNFNWFVDGDFIMADQTMVKLIAGYLYATVITAYVVKELATAVRTRYVNLPKNLLITVTFLTWYFGIVHFNGDLSFTLLNVVTHGIPYMALVWLFRRREDRHPALGGPSTGIRGAVVVFVLSIVTLAYFEEGLWDGLVWREHGAVFAPFSMLPTVRSHELLALLVPLLSLPQATHYILDGFIWRKNHGR